MLNYKQKSMLWFMVQLIHPKILVDDSLFKDSENFWEYFVQLGSSHLVLPALYASLKRKKLDYHAPPELLNYLNKILIINKNQNKEILKQITFISKLFNKNNIEHVFIKGAAILILQPYNSVNERMLGDIDILVAEKNLTKAQKLLIDKGFEETNDELDLVEGIFLHKHLKRIIHPNYICAVELHRRVLDVPISLLNINDILQNKTQTKEGYWIPSRNDLWIHAILNWQINDKGYSYNNFSLRTFIDVIYLEPFDFKNDISIYPHISHFYSICSTFTERYQNRNFIASTIFKLKISSPNFQFFYDLILKTKIKLSLILNRLLLFMCSKGYRNRIYNNSKIFLKRINTFFHE